MTRALAWTGDHRALPALLDLTGDADRGALDRAEAILALGWICDKERVVWDARISIDLNYTPGDADPHGRFVRGDPGHALSRADPRGRPTGSIPLRRPGVSRRPARSRG